MNTALITTAVALVIAVVRLHAAGCYARCLEDELRDVQVTLARSRVATRAARHRFDRAFTPGEN